MKLWHAAYGVTMVGLIITGFVAAGMGADTVRKGMLESLGTALLYGILVQIGLFTFFSVVERALSAAGPRKSFKRYLLNLKVFFFGSVITPALTAVVAACSTILGKHLGLGLIDLRFSSGHGPGVLILAFLLTTLIFDFFYYWFHRFGHESPLLWQQHKLHHMDEELCAVNRDHPLEALLVGVAVTIPMTVLFKLDPLQGSVLAYGIAAWVVFIHTNIKMSLGPASVLFAAPQVHRIHHSRLPEHFDQNYAAFFPIWDILFGTYCHPKLGEYPPTGVHDEREVTGFGEAVMVPFRGWRKWFRNWSTRSLTEPASAVIGGSSKDQWPIEVDVVAGKSYLWCACGLSKNQPFCDGSHKDTSVVPLRYRAKASGKEAFCVCKRTSTPPFCDCAHETRRVAS